MIGAIVFARMASTRLPSKVMINVQDKPILQQIIERVRRSEYIQKVVIATSSNPSDDQIVELSRSIGADVFRGSENDVLDRCFQAAKQFSIDPIVRITADDPFKDPDIIDQVIKAFVEARGRYDLVCNTLRPTFPEGLDVEVMSFHALREAWSNSTDPSEREHITQHMFKNPEKFQILNIENSENISNIRLTLDTPEDLKFVKIIYDALYPAKMDFTWKDVISYLRSRPELLEINKNVKKSGRYQGAK